MKITVRLFASLADHYPSARAAVPFEFDVAPDCTLARLSELLNIPPDELKVAFVNGRIESLDTQLHPGAEVGLFPPIGGGSGDIALDVWLYGELARYGDPAARLGFAHVTLTLPAGSAVRHLLAALSLPTEERGITFISGNLSAMPGVQPDLDHVLQDGDRVAFFHLNSMWPFQYRHGAAMVEEMRQALAEREGGGMHHAYKQGE